MVLIVDGNKTAARSLARYLRTCGVAADYVHDAEEALEYLNHAIQPRLLVLEQALEGQTGVELLRQLREMKETREIEVLFYTDGEHEAARQEASQLGAIAWMKKGETPLPDLLEVVHERIWG